MFSRFEMNRPPTFRHRPENLCVHCSGATLSAKADARNHLQTNASNKTRRSGKKTIRAPMPYASVFRTDLAFVPACQAGARINANMIAASAKFQIVGLTWPVALQITMLVLAAHQLAFGAHSGKAYAAENTTRRGDGE